MIQGTNMILNCINKMTEYNHSIYDSTMIVVSFLASRLRVPYACTTKLTRDEYDYLTNNADYNLLLQEPGDYFTPILESLGIISELPESKLNDMIGSLNKIKEPNMPLLNLILPHHTTKMMYETYKRFGNQHVYAVVEPDSLEYKINLLTAKINNIPAIILNVSPDIYNISMSSNNWDFANNWDGPVYSRLELANIK